eukprot:TRINITY_DN5975_c0_g1_i1.p3 TRINITY_DN5975_c0_g1~~TRINITY_DN5975_c0_g1_i1.p3  ORF type:complete len:150 (-),score=8.17 TRINITY_DN5975_c0_g1_i1:561-1010(-)
MPRAAPVRPARSPLKMPARLSQIALPTQTKPFLILVSKEAALSLMLTQNRAKRPCCASKGRSFSCEATSSGTGYENGSEDDGGAEAFGAGGGDGDTDSSSDPESTSCQGLSSLLSLMAGDGGTLPDVTELRSYSVGSLVIVYVLSLSAL